MRLSECETFVVGNPPPGFGGRYFIFIKLVTDCGIIGYGEIYAASFSAHLTAKLAKDVFARYLFETDPHNIETFMRRAYSSGFTQRPDPTVAGVVSGLEIAMMDIVGKAHDMPCNALLGGRVHDRLRCYTYLYPNDGETAADFYNDADASAERAAQKRKEGFTAVKFDPAGAYTSFDGHMPAGADIARSHEFCRKIREAVGGSCDLLFGTHGQFTAAGAIRLAQAIAEFDPLWFEEPIPPDNPAEMAKVARAVSIPVATGERLCMASEFAAILDHSAAAILQPDLGRVGGIREAAKIAAMAAVKHVQIAPHLYCGPIVAAANIQFAAATPNFLIAEMIDNMTGFHARLLNNPIQVEDGYVLVPTQAGLGVTLNEEVARAYPYEGDKLHLEMRANPYDNAHSGEFAGG